MSGVSLAGLLGRLVVSMVVVLGLMMLAAWAMKRRGTLLTHRSPFNVVARQSLGRNASLQVVTVGDRALVLGVTEHNVTLLAEADVELFPAAREGERDSGSGAQRTALPAGEPTAPPGPAWKASLVHLKERAALR